MTTGLAPDRLLPAAVLWDMDGTLVDTEPYWFDAERELVESFGGEWPESHARAVVGFDLLDSAEYIREHGGVPLDPYEIVDRLLDSVVDRLRERIPWRPGARRLLRDLNEAGVPCALVTMSWRRFVEPILAALPPDSFEAVITGDEVPLGEGKPQPTPYRMGAKAVGAHPRDCIAIEDSPTGVRSAVAAGCHVIGVPNVRSIKPGRNVTVVPSLREVGLDELADLISGRPLHDDDDDERPERAPRRGGLDRRALTIGAVAVAIGALIVFAVTRGGDDAPPPLPPGAIPIDVWVPYWTLGDDEMAVLDSRLDSVREVSPFWYGTHGVEQITVDANASTDAIEDFLDQADSSPAQLVPSIKDEMAAGQMAAILADPETRSRHVDAIVEFADEVGADGIDLDYEQFAYADGADTWAATQPNWVAFVEEVAAALHDDGRTLTVSIPPVYDETVTGERGYWVYDHGTIAEFVDAIRIMGYDYSTNQPGPIAPLDWVRQAVEGVSKAVPEEYHSKLVLGVPAYGYNWVTSTAGTCPTTAEDKTTVTSRSVLDLATRRSGAPVYDQVTGEWSFTYDLTVTDATTSCVQSRVVQWVDAEGAAARAEIARRAGWGGAALWALGYDDDAVWAALVAATRNPISAELPAV